VPYTTLFRSVDLPSVGEVGAVGLAAADAGVRHAPVDVVALTRGVLAAELEGVHAPFGVGQAREVQEDAVLLGEPGEPQRLAVGRAIVGPVEGEAGCCAELRAEVEEPAPEHAHGARPARVGVDRAGLRAQPGAHRGGALFVLPQLEGPGVGEAGQVPGSAAEDRFFPSDARAEGDVRLAARLPGG